MITGAAAAALLATSGIAAAAPAASKLSLSNATVRTGAPVQKASKFGSGFPFIIAAVVIAAGVGIYFLVRDDKPDSP